VLWIEMPPPRRSYIFLEDLRHPGDFNVATIQRDFTAVLESLRTTIVMMPRRRSVYDGEDLYQDLYLKIRQSGATVDWTPGRIVAAAKNHLRDVLRRERRKRLAEARIERATDEPSPVLALEARERDELLERSLRCLSTATRDVLISEKPLTLLAKSLGCTPNTLRIRKCRAIKALGGALRRGAPSGRSNRAAYVLSRNSRAS
jgi:DNA-directed RNA polymerase specialized sigma24 family protein